MILSVEGYTTAVDTLRGTKKDYIKFGNYVSPENRNKFYKMAQGTHKEGKKSAVRGLGRFGPAGSLLYPVGASVGALKSIAKDTLLDAIESKVAR